MGDITQEGIDKCLEALRVKWAEMVTDSGKTQTVFLATDKSATQFLADYEFMKEAAAEQGWLLPVLIEGIEVSFK
jgi:hypothetical protein